MSKILVIRHSKTKANEEGILMGVSFKMNSDLSKNGIEIAHTKGSALRRASFNPNKVYCSDLNRTKQTAEIILEELGLKLALTKLAGLNERDFGEHDDKPEQAFYLKGGIEAVKHFVERVIRSLNQIKAETTGTTLVVTHSNPLMVMQAALFQPDSLYKFWKLGDPNYCEGFEYSF